MVQSGDDYREKNRIRLQRFYEKQKRQGKKRVSALVSDEAYRLLTEEKDQAGKSISTLVDQAVMVAYGEHGIPNIVSDEAYALLMDAKEHTGDSMSTLIDRAVKAAFGYEDLLDIDDPALNEEIIANFEGPGQDDTGMEPGAIEDAVNAMGGPVESIEQDQADAQGDDVEDIELDITLVNPDPETDDAALGDQEPDTATDEPEPRGEQIESIAQAEPDTAQADASTHVETDTDTLDPDIIPDCTGKEITIEERDNILMQVERLLPGKENIQARVDLLNEKSVPVIVKAGKYGGAWDKKKFSNNLRLAKKRLGDQAPVTDDTTTAAQDPLESIRADDTAGGDQEPDTAVESEKVTEILPEADPADDLVGQDKNLVEPITDDQDPDIIPDCTGRIIDRQERDRILVQLEKRMQGSTPEIVQARVDLLNEKSVPVSLKSSQYGGEWTRKKFTDNLRAAKKRLGSK